MRLPSDAFGQYLLTHRQLRPSSVFASFLLTSSEYLLPPKHLLTSPTEQRLSSSSYRLPLRRRWSRRKARKELTEGARHLTARPGFHRGGQRSRGRAAAATLAEQHAHAVGDRAGATRWVPAPLSPGRPAISGPGSCGDPCRAQRAHSGNPQRGYPLGALPASTGAARNLDSLPAPTPAPCAARSWLLANRGLPRPGEAPEYTFRAFL